MIPLKTKEDVDYGEVYATQIDPEVDAGNEDRSDFEGALLDVEDDDDYE